MIKRIVAGILLLILSMAIPNNSVKMTVIASIPYIHTRLIYADFELLVKAINSESHGETYYDKLCVGSVIINRLYSDAFPNSLDSVIFQSNQFSGLNSKYFRITEQSKSDIDSYNAALQILKHGSVINALYFVNPSISNQKQWIQYLHDNHILVEKNENHLYFL